VVFVLNTNNLQNGKKMQYTEQEVAEKVMTLKALNQVVADNSVKLGGTTLLHLWFIDTVEDRILDSKSDFPSWVFKKSMDQILSLYFEQDRFFSLLYGYEDNSEAIDAWLLETGCMVNVEDVEEEEVA